MLMICDTFCINFHIYCMERQNKTQYFVKIAKKRGIFMKHFSALALAAAVLMCASCGGEVIGGDIASYAIDGGMDVIVGERD